MGSRIQHCQGFLKRKNNRLITVTLTESITTHTQKKDKKIGRILVRKIERKKRSINNTPLLKNVRVIRFVNNSSYDEILHHMCLAFGWRFCNWPLPITATKNDGKKQTAISKGSRDPRSHQRGGSRARQQQQENFRIYPP